MEHRSLVIVFRSNAIDNNNDDEKMTPNDVNEEAEDSLQERSSKENSCNRNRKKEALKETVRKKEALKKAVHKTIPHLLHLSMLIISSVFLFLKNLVPMLCCRGKYRRSWLNSNFTRKNQSSCL